jgi:hypothetical protein
VVGVSPMRSVTVEGGLATIGAGAGAGAYHGDNRGRLLRVKRRYDPDGVFGPARAAQPRPATPPSTTAEKSSVRPSMPAT